MNKSPRMRFIAVCVGAALAQMAGSALADSGTGVDTAVGNANNAIYQPGMQFKDENWTDVKRTPTGQMYNFPVAVGAAEDGRLVGSIEGGFLSSDDKHRYSKLNEYNDPQVQGLYLNNFSLSYDSAASPFYFSVNGGGVGRDDQFYNGVIGSYNSWKIKAFYQETPHVFSDTWRPAYNNGISEGGGVYLVGQSQTLKSALAAGSVASGPLGLALGGIGLQTAANGPVTPTGAYFMPATGEIMLLRAKGGARLEVGTNDLKFFGSATQENRDGNRPWGAAGTGSNGVMEVPEPIHYVTRNFLAGLNFVHGNLAANLTGKFDTFHNDVKSFLVPTAAANPTVAADGSYNNATQMDRYASYPDNSQWELKADVAYKMPQFLNSKFNLTGAYGQNRQNDSIDAPLPYVPGVFVAPTLTFTNSATSGLAAADQTALTNPSNWDGVNGVATSRAKGGMRADTTLLNFTWTAKPIKDLGIKANYRYWNYKNKSGLYYAYNPLTGTWGEGIQEGASSALLATAAVAGVSGAATSFYLTDPATGGCYAPPGINSPAAAASCTAQGAAASNTANGIPTGAGSRGLVSPPRSYKQRNANLTVSYDLSDTLGSLEGSVEQEIYNRTFRERDETWENKFKIGYINTRGIEDMTIRASYEYDRKGGSFYDNTVSGRYIDNYMLAYNVAGYATSGTVGSHQAAWQQLIANANAGVANSPSVNWLATMISAGQDGRTGGAAIAAPGGMQKTDQADRRQQIFNGRVNYQAAENLDLGLYFQGKRVSYPTNMEYRLGAVRDDLDTVSLDFNYQPSPDTQINGYYTRQGARQTDMLNYGGTANGILNATNNNAAAGLCLGPTTNASAAAPLNTCAVSVIQQNSVAALFNAIRGTQRDPLMANIQDTFTTNNVFGLGLQQNIGTARFGLDYSMNMSHTSIRYTYSQYLMNRMTAGSSILNSMLTGLPDQSSRQQTLAANLLIPLTDRLSTRLMYRYDTFTVQDWHYDYASPQYVYGALTAAGVAGNGPAYLLNDTGPQNFHVSTVGALLRYKL